MEEKKKERAAVGRKGLETELKNSVSLASLYNYLTITIFRLAEKSPAVSW